MRAFAAFIAAFVGAGLIAAVLAYPAYEMTQAVASWPFHRVASRIAMLVLALELIWLCRCLHLATRGALGYGLPWQRFVGQSLAWGLMGCVTASLGAAFLLSAHLRVLTPSAGLSFMSLTHLLLAAAASGIAVALIEETVMRGALHTAIERESGPWAASLLTAVLFAVTHFFAKVRIPEQEIAWRSGFDLLQRSFAPLAHASLVLDSFLSWMAVGLVLSLSRILTGNIAVAIGLHAGWVLILRLLQEASVRTAPGTGFFEPWVGRFDGLLGYWILPWSATVAAGLWVTRVRWVPYARGDNRSRR